MAAVLPSPTGLPSHPRLLLSPQMLQRLRAKAAARDPDWQRVLAHADQLSAFPVAAYDRSAAPARTIVYAYQGFGWLDAVTSLGLAYQVTGRKAYARKVVEVLRAINATSAVSNLEPISVDRGFPSRSAALGVALAFDWVYPELDGETRVATVRTLNRWFDWHAAEALDRDGPAASNYFGGHLLGFGAAGVATAGDNARAGEIVAHARRRFDEVVAPAFADGGPFAGGFPLEGYVYGTNHFKRLLEAAGTIGATSVDATELAERMARNLIHAVGPGRWRVPVEADYPGETTGVLALDLPLLLAHALAGRPVGANIQHLIATRGTPPDEAGAGRPGVEWLLYWDGARPAHDPVALEPTFLHSRGDEHLFMRSGWSRDAVWASFNGGLTVLSGHQARAAGHLAVQRGDDDLLAYAGQWKGKDGLGGQPQQFQNTSAYANTLFVDDGGEYLYSGERYLGGQGLWATTRSFPFAQDADSTWARLDATPMYDRKPGSQDAATRSVRQFVRSFVYLSPGTFVVFDRIRMLKPSYAKSVRFHLGGATAPRVSGTLASSVVGGSALHVRVLWPTEAALTVGWNAVGGVKLNPRLEVTTRAPGTDLDALTVLFAQDRRASVPEAQLVTVDGGAMLGVHLKGSPDARERVVLFAAAPPGTPPISAGVRYRVVQAGPGRHHLFDLAPGQVFDVHAAVRPEGAIEVTVSPAGQGAAGAVRLSSSDVGALVFDLLAGDVRSVPVDPRRISRTR